MGKTGNGRSRAPTASSVALAAAALLLAVASGAARADVDFFTGNPSGFSSALNTLNIDDENVNFNEPGLTQTGLTVQGQTNQTDRVINFTGNVELTTPAAGQARIEALDPDDVFHTVTVAPRDDCDFVSLSFNVNTIPNGDRADGENQNKTYGTFTLTLTGSGIDDSDLVTKYDLDQSGSTFVGIVAYNSQTLSSVEMTTNDARVVSIDDVRQFRIGGIDCETIPPPEEVPEPASLALFLPGLAALGMVRRRKRTG